MSQNPCNIRHIFQHIIFFLIAAFASINAFAQQTREERRDSLKALRDTAVVRYVDNRTFEDFALMRYIEKDDTSIHSFRHFDPSIKKYIGNASLGNIGTANTSLIFFNPFNRGFDIGMHAFDAYMLTNENCLYYNTRRPYTTLSYNLGMGSEHVLKVMHTQRIFPTLQLGIQYNHTNSDGFYQRQGVVRHDIRFFGRYHSYNNKYKMVFNYTHNEMDVYENGGLRNDSTFIYNGLLFNGTIAPNMQRNSYPVMLDSANNRWYNNGVFIQHGYTFDRKKDSLAVDDERPLFTFMHTAYYNNDERRFRDGMPNNNFYGNVLVDSSYSLNKYTTHEVSNEIKAIFYMRKKYASKSPLSGGIKHQFIHLKNNVGYLQGDTLRTDSTFNRHAFHNLSAFGQLHFDFAEQFALAARADYYFAGYNLNDLHIAASAIYHSKDSAKVHHSFVAFFNFRLVEPTYIQHQFYSNHRQWNNSFGKQRIVHVGATYKAPEWNLDATFNAYLLNNYIYFDQNITPQQNTGVNSVFTLEIHKRFRAWRFYFDNYFTGQYSSSDIIRLPYFVGRFSFYYQGYLFKKALLLNAGFDITYNTPYKANAYAPVTSQFYLQDQITTGNYPFLDIFISAQVKTVRIFVKLRNTNQRWPNVPYFGTPHNPLQDRSVQVGLSWNFYN